jgi:hypothetical protein
MKAVCKAYRSFARKPECKRSFRRTGDRQKVNIKMNFLEIGLGGADWIHLAQDRDKKRVLLNMVMNLRTP